MFSLAQVVPDFFLPNQNSEIWGKEVNFEKGKSYRITAPSGSGKSSLIQFLSGLNSKYSGEIMFDGGLLKSLHQNAKSDIRSSRLSIVFQDLRLIPRLSLMENLLLKSHFSEGPEEKIKDLLLQFGVYELRTKPVQELSQGEKQRGAIVRALCQKFDFLLLDEPFSHLNEKWLKIIWGILKDQQMSLGAGMIFTSLDGKESWNFDAELKL